jgi:hypothetical protein
MRLVLVLALAVVFSGMMAPIAEAGPAQRIHKAKIALIKKILRR